MKSQGPAASLQMLLLKLRVDCLEFEVSQLKAVGRKILSERKERRKVWEDQLRILVEER